MIYEEVRKPADQRKIPIRQIMRAEAIEVWKRYEAKEDRVPY
jgi:guanine deaminase